MALPAANKQMIVEGIKLVLKGLGEDPNREGLKATPERVSKMYEDVLDGRFISTDDDDFTAFKEDTFDGAVMIHKIPFYAFCEHHLALFHGKFSIAYVPDEKILGLSKLVRIFRVGCKRITIQERITHEAVSLLMKVAKPHGAICYVEAEHTCMSLRGVKSPGSRTITVAQDGEYSDNAELRQQFLALAGAPLGS